MSTNILYGNSAVNQNEIFNTFFVGIHARWAWSPWAQQVSAGHSSLFKFCHPAIHIAVVQSTIPTNRDKFTMNINTVITFCTKKFYDGMLFFSWELHNYQYTNSHYRNYIWVCMHWPLETDWWLSPSPKSIASSPPAGLQQQLLYSHSKNLCITSGLHLVKSNWF